MADNLTSFSLYSEYALNVGHRFNVLNWEKQQWETMQVVSFSRQDCLGEEWINTGLARLVEGGG